MGTLLNRLGAKNLETEEEGGCCEKGDLALETLADAVLSGEASDKVVPLLGL